MDYRVSASDRAAFKRCRRQWDLAAGPRQNLAETFAPRLGAGGAGGRYLPIPPPE